MADERVMTITVFKRGRHTTRARRAAWTFEDGPRGSNPLWLPHLYTAV